MPNYLLSTHDINVTSEYQLAVSVVRRVIGQMYTGCDVPIALRLDRGQLLFPASM